MPLTTKGQLRILPLAQRPEDVEIHCCALACTPDMRAHTCFFLSCHSHRPLDFLKAGMREREQ